MKNVLSIIKKLPLFSVSLIACVLAACFLAVVIFTHNGAAKIAGDVGEAGAILFEGASGLVEGTRNGPKQGHADGLSAQDTEAAIQNALRHTANLRVLAASARITDFHSIGNDVEYAAIYMLQGDVIFSVDLSKAEISLLDQKMTITLPRPQSELHFDERHKKR